MDEGELFCGWIMCCTFCNLKLPLVLFLEFDSKVSFNLSFSLFIFTSKEQIRWNNFCQLLGLYITILAYISCNFRYNYCCILINSSCSFGNNNFLRPYTFLVVLQFLGHHLNFILQTIFNIAFFWRRWRWRGRK